MTCPTCKGKGTTKCTACNGSGYTGGLFAGKCSRCNGAKEAPCPNCKGKGQV